MKLTTTEARQFMAGFWEAAEYAYDEMIVCEVAIARTDNPDNARVEVMAKLPHAEIAYIVGVRLSDKTMEALGKDAGEAMLQWMRAAIDNPRIQEKIAAWEAAGRKLEFRVAPFMGRRA